jgi:hypothetical protein
MTKRTVSWIYATIAVVVCLLVAFALYEVTVPRQDAADYLQRLEASGNRLKASYKTIGKTNNLNVFNNPDTAAQTSTQDLATIDSDIQDSQRQLAAFDKVANSLKRPPLTISVGTVHKAEVQQAQAHTIVAQSQDVLNQYQQLSDFLKTYYGYEKAFQSATASVDNVGDLSTLSSQTAQLSAQAEQLQEMSAVLASQPAPEGYRSLTTAAAPMYQQASQGFSELAAGLISGSDDQTNNGVALIEAAVNTHDSSVAGLPPTLDNTAYVFQEVNELPDKIENLFS